MAWDTSSGWETELGIGKEAEVGTLITPTLGLEVVDPRPRQTVGREEWEGMAGSRAANKIHDVVTTLAPEGSWQMPVKNEDVALLLELLTGDASSPYVLSTSLSTFSLCADVGPKQFQHKGCKINTCVFEASQENQILRATIEYLGMTQAVAAAGNETIPTPNATQAPFLFRQLVLELADTAFYAQGLRLNFNNNLDGETFRNSQTRLGIPEGIAAVDGELTIDWNSDYYTAFYALLIAGTFAKLEATFTNGSYVLKFQLDSIKFTEGAPEPSRDNRVMLTLPFSAKASTIGGTDLYTITVTNPA